MPTQTLNQPRQLKESTLPVAQYVSVVMPCLNESATLPLVIECAREALSRYGLSGEVVVADNGSIDGSQEIARAHGARVVDVSQKGYGAALTGGIKASQGAWIMFADADNTYNFMEIDRFAKALANGADFVIGTRLKGSIEHGAMPLLHRYLGTPVLTTLINWFFKTNISDCNCGFRAFTAEVFERFDIHSTGMEFASEMIIKAGLLQVKMSEVPVSLRKDRRDRIPHLRTWRDGWRHLRFIIAYATDQILLMPGILSTALGAILMLLLANGPLRVHGFHMDYHFLFPASLAVLFGIQLIFLTLMAKAYTGLSKYKKDEKQIGIYLREEPVMILGILLFLIGLGLNLNIVFHWHYGEPLFAVRPGIVAMTLMAAGAQVFSNAFFIGVLQIPKR